MKNEQMQTYLHGRSLNFTNIIFPSFFAEQPLGCKHYRYFYSTLKNVGKLPSELPQEHILKDLANFSKKETIAMFAYKTALAPNAYIVSEI